MNRTTQVNQDKAHGLTGLSRRQLFRSAGTVALGGLALSLAPQIRTVAHEEGEAALEIHMGEMYFETHEGEKNGPIHVEAGEELQIRFENEGNVEHEAHFGVKPFKNSDGHYVDYEEHLFDGLWGIHLQPGQTADLHLRIPEDKRGEWEIGCFIPGHYEAGMHAPFVVE